MRATTGSGHAESVPLGVISIVAVLALGLAVVSRPVVPASADDSQNVTIPEAVAQAAQSGQPVLATAESTDTTTIQANANGSLTATIGAGPVQEPDPSSSTGWTPINLTLQDNGDGTVGPAVSAADTSFSAGGSGAMATLSQGSDSYAESWNGSLPTPDISGDTATYRDVLPDVDLDLQAETTGFEQSFVVHSAPAHALVLDVPLSLRGLSATVDENGNLVVTDSHGNTVATSGTAVMYGAAMDSAGEPVYSETLPTQVVSGQSGPVLQISPDQSFFSNPELTYPVTIDPSPNLSVTNDSYVKSTDASSSFSTDTVLKVGSPNSGTDVYRTLISFPTLSTLITTNPIDVQSASLNLFETDSGSCTASEMDVYAATSSWDSTVTWTTQPSAGSLYASVTTANGHSGSCPNASVSVATGGTGGLALTNLVQAWADGTATNHGIILQAASESSTSGYKKFKSSEYGSNAPTLAVTYNTLPNVPTSLSSDSSAADQPVLNATFTDPDGGTGDVEYTISTDAYVTVLVAAGASVSSGVDSPLTIALGTLQDGHAYEWKGRSFDGIDYSSYSTWQSFYFDTTPAVPTLVQASDGVLTASTSPTLVASYEDPNGGIGTISFKLMDAGCTSIISSGTGTTVAAGDLSQWTPTLSPTLTIGTTYGVEAEAVDASGSTSGYTSCQSIEVATSLTPMAPTDGTISSSLTPILTVQLGSTAPVSEPATFTIYDASDDSLVAAGTGSTAAAGANSQWSVPSGLLVAGSEYYWIADASAAISTYPTAYFTVGSGPSVSLVNPSLPATGLDGVVPLTGVPSGFDSVTRVEYYVDGSLIGQSSSSPYTLSWTVTPTSGTHSIYATAYGVVAGGSVSVQSTASSFDFGANPDVDVNGCFVRSFQDPHESFGTPDSVDAKVTFQCGRSASTIKLAMILWLCTDKAPPKSKYYLEQDPHCWPEGVNGDPIDPAAGRHTRTAPTPGEGAAQGTGWWIACVTWFSVGVNGTSPLHGPDFNPSGPVYLSVP